MKGGYTGRVLVVELDSGEISARDYPPAYAEDHLGGFGPTTGFSRSFPGRERIPFLPTTRSSWGLAPSWGRRCRGLPG